MSDFLGLGPYCCTDCIRELQCGSSCVRVNHRVHLTHLCDEVSTVCDFLKTDKEESRAGVGRWYKCYRVVCYLCYYFPYLPIQEYGPFVIWPSRNLSLDEVSAAGCVHRLMSVSVVRRGRGCTWPGSLFQILHAGRELFHVLFTLLNVFV